MKLTIVTTPKSITIYDADHNRITVLRGDEKIELHSTILDHKKAKVILSIQQEITNTLLNPKNPKNSFSRRFNHLAKELNAINTHSFLTIKRALLAREVQPA